MGYDNNNGGCCGGWGFPFGGFMNGFGGLGFDALLLFLFFGLMGGGMWGGMGGWGMGGMGWGGGAGMLGATSLAANETASLISQQNTADRVAAIGADVRQILGQTGGIIEAVNTVGNRTQDGFANVRQDMCQLGHSQAMQSVNNYNGLTGQITDLRYGMQQNFCDLRHQMQSDKCDTFQAMNANTAAIMARIDCLEKNAMQDKLNAAQEKIATLKAERDNSAQTQTLLAAIQANGCKPACAPCGPVYPYGFCNPCVDGIQRAVNDALGTRIGEILFPATTPAAAA
jgi:hypothetical protein